MTLYQDRLTLRSKACTNNHCATACSLASLKICCSYSLQWTTKSVSVCASEVTAALSLIYLYQLWRHEARRPDHGACGWLAACHSLGDTKVAKLQQATRRNEAVTALQVSVDDAL